MTSLQDFADDIQREPLYAAYRAAHEQIERLGDDLLDDSIIQTAVKAYEAKLIEQGRLLTPGGEPEWGWRGWSNQDPQRGMPLRDEAAAREVVAAHPGTELVRRQVGPWEVVPVGEAAR